MSEAQKEEQFAKLGEVIARYQGVKGALMPVLQEAQGIFGHVPQEVQEAIALGLGVPLADVYGVATFYSQFALNPRGKHIVGVCLGTACYVKGAQAVAEKVASELAVQVGDTTQDRHFTLNATRCLGCCGLAPVMMIDEDVYGQLTPDDIPGILAKYKEA